VERARPWVETAAAARSAVRAVGEQVRTGPAAKHRAAPDEQEPQGSIESRRACRAYRLADVSTDVTRSPLEVVVLAHRTLRWRSHVCAWRTLLQSRLLQPEVHGRIAAQRWCQRRDVSHRGRARHTGVQAAARLVGGPSGWRSPRRRPPPPRRRPPLWRQSRPGRRCLPSRVRGAPKQQALGRSDHSSSGLCATQLKCTPPLVHASATFSAVFTPIQQ
jgi:hypothetical protein